MEVVVLDKKGMTLVEVMIALVVLLFVSLAMMQTALVGIDSNMINVLRDEAVNIAEMRMNEARNIPFDDPQMADNCTTQGTDVSTTRNIRNIPNFSYTVYRRVCDQRGGEDKQVRITVTWEWKEKTVANGNPYTHTISTLLRR